MTPLVWTYLSYLLISVALTVWVARTLFKNGESYAGTTLLTIIAFGSMTLLLHYEF